MDAHHRGYPRGTFIASLMALIAAMLAGAVQAETWYTATPIPGASTNVWTRATAINAGGAIIGYRYAPDPAGTGGGTSPDSGFVFEAGVVTDLGAFIPSGINDRGEIVGRNRDEPWRAIVMTNGSAGNSNVPATYASRASAVNSAGTVAGGYQSASSLSERGFVLIGGAFVDLGTLTSVTAYPTVPAAINASGDIVGSSGVDAASFHAFLWSNGRMRDLGTLGGSTSWATGINAGGDIVGASDMQHGERSAAFLYSNGVMRNLGAPAGGTSSANGINTAGEIVGSYSTGNDTRGFIYSGGSMRDLNALVLSGLDGAVLSSANAINDSSQIAATACSEITCFGVRLDPIPGQYRVAIEYHHAAFDHYFISTDPGEIGELDRGAFEGWTRTGQAFLVPREAGGGTSPVCRFFSTSFGAKSSHFYTASPLECAFVQSELRADWMFEGDVFWVATPNDAGACPAATVPVYRVYNNGQGGAPNHRYTTSLTVRGQMIASGWIPEGQGTLGVAMCAIS